MLVVFELSILLYICISGDFIPKRGYSKGSKALSMNTVSASFSLVSTAKLCTTYGKCKKIDTNCWRSRLMPNTWYICTINTSHCAVLNITY